MCSSNLRMQTLGIAESTPRTESRFKSLFWPSIQSGADVDYLGAQGYWVCVIIAAINLVFGIASSGILAGILVAVFSYLSGIGVRERSRFAALVMLIVMTLDSLVMGINVPRVLFIALLFSNVRATWLAATWRPDSEEAALPPRTNETFGDKFVDCFPQWVWPKIRYVYYVFALLYLLVECYGVFVITTRRLTSSVSGGY